MSYTDQELLLLSNFVYIPVCMSDKTLEEIIEPYRDEKGLFSPESVAKAAYGGGMSCEDVATVFTEMDEHIAENPDFGKLSASRSLDEYNVRAICYTGPKDNDPVVAFRGTGGTRSAWSDNFEGAFGEDTKIQRIADDFLKNDCGIYDDIVVTGHSKGGNLAQYVTVRQQERISSCTSFDGQGFSEYFLEAYGDEIKTAAPKIRSVSAYNDFVNILLTSIAGTCIYVANEDSVAAAHSSVTLLTANDFDADGNIASVRGQSVVSEQLGRLTDRAVAALSGKSDGARQAFSSIMGSAISLALTTPRDELKEGALAPALGLMSAQFAKDLMCFGATPMAEETLVSHSAYVDMDTCFKSVGVLGEESAKMKRMVSSVMAIRSDLAYSVTAKICAERSLENICEDLAREARELENYALVVENAIGMYAKTETELTTLMNA